jgi:hypothetical protein
MGTIAIASTARSVIDVTPGPAAQIKSGSTGVQPLTHATYTAPLSLHGQVGARAGPGDNVQSTSMPPPWMPPDTPAAAAGAHLQLVPAHAPAPT